MWEVVLWLSILLLWYGVEASHSEHSYEYLFTRRNGVVFMEPLSIPIHKNKENNTMYIKNPSPKLLNSSSSLFDLEDLRHEWNDAFQRFASGRANRRIAYRTGERDNQLMLLQRLTSPTEEQLCTYGLTKFVDCNHCVCIGGQIYVCTVRECRGSEQNSLSAFHRDTNCIEGEIIRSFDQCNRCYCGGGRILCTRRKCNNPDQPARKECEPGVSIPSPDGCNSCACNTRGMIVCTTESCGPEISSNLGNLGCTPNAWFSMSNNRRCKECYCVNGKIAFCYMHLCRSAREQGHAPTMLKRLLPGSLPDKCKKMDYMQDECTKCYCTANKVWSCQTKNLGKKCTNSRPEQWQGPSNRRPPNGGPPNRRPPYRHPPNGGPPNRRPPIGDPPNYRPPNGGPHNRPPPHKGPPNRRPPYNNIYDDLEYPRYPKRPQVYDDNYYIYYDVYGPYYVPRYPQDSGGRYPPGNGKSSPGNGKRPPGKGKRPAGNGKRPPSGIGGEGRYPPSSGSGKERYPPGSGGGKERYPPGASDLGYGDENGGVVGGGGGWHEPPTSPRSPKLGPVTDPIYIPTRHPEIDDGERPSKEGGWEKIPGSKGEIAEGDGEGDSFDVGGGGNGEEKFSVDNLAPGFENNGIGFDISNSPPGQGNAEFETENGAGNGPRWSPITVHPKTLEKGQNKIPPPENPPGQIGTPISGGDIDTNNDRGPFCASGQFFTLGSANNCQACLCTPSNEWKCWNIRGACRAKAKCNAGKLKKNARSPCSICYCDNNGSSYCATDELCAYTLKPSKCEAISCLRYCASSNASFGVCHDNNCICVQ